MLRQALKLSIQQVLIESHHDGARLVNISVRLRPGLAGVLKVSPDVAGSGGRSGRGRAIAAERSRGDGELDEAVSVGRFAGNPVTRAALAVDDRMRQRLRPIRRAGVRRAGVWDAGVRGCSLAGSGYETEGQAARQTSAEPLENAPRQRPHNPR